MRIVIFDPYRASGGASGMQETLQAMMRELADRHEIVNMSVASTRRGVSGIIEKLRRVQQCKAKTLRTDVLVLQSSLDIATIALGWWAARSGIRHLLILHGDLIPTVRQMRQVNRPIARWALWLAFGRTLLARCDAVVVSSVLEKDRLCRVGAKWRRIRVIPNAIVRDLQVAPPDPTSIGQGQTDSRFALWLGRISREKGLDLLVECWPFVLKKCPGAVLLIVGTVRHKDVYKKLLRRRDQLALTESIRIEKWVSVQQKTKLLSEARCLVLPSHVESFGNVVTEALTLGTPVVASTGTPWPELDGPAGRWIRRDPELWADAIADYLQLPNKYSVPPHEVERLLAPCQLDVVTNAWSRLLKEVLLDQRPVLHEQPSSV